MDAALLRPLTPSVTGIVARRGADFAAAEDAVQNALVEALRVWPGDPPRNPRGRLVAVAWRRFLDAARADTARQRCGLRAEDEPAPGPGGSGDDMLWLYFLCAHPARTPASAVALTLRVVGGPSTRRIARAGLVPEATMAQRISRAERTVSGVRFDQPGDVNTVLRTLYIVFTEGFSGDVGLAAGAIRLTRRPGPSTRRRRARSPGCCSTPHGARHGSAPTAAPWFVSPAPSRSARPWDHGPVWPP